MDPKIPRTANELAAFFMRPYALLAIILVVGILLVAILWYFNQPSEATKIKEESDAATAEFEGKADHLRKESGNIKIDAATQKGRIEGQKESVEKTRTETDKARDDARDAIKKTQDAIDNPTKGVSLEEAKENCRKMQVSIGKDPKECEPQ